MLSLIGQIATEITGFGCAAGLGASLSPLRQGELALLDEHTQKVFQKIFKDAGVRENCEVRYSPKEHFGHAVFNLDAGSNLSSTPILYLHTGVFTDKIGTVSYKDVTFFAKWQASLIKDNARCVVFLAGLVTTLAAAFFIHLCVAPLLGVGAIFLTAMHYEERADEFAIRTSTSDELILADRACRALVKEGVVDVELLANKIMTANVNAYYEEAKKKALSKTPIVEGMTRVEANNILATVPEMASQVSCTATEQYCAAVGIAAPNIWMETWA